MTFYRIPWTGIEVRRNVLPNPSGRVSLTGIVALGAGAELNLEPGIDTYAATTVTGVGAGDFGSYRTVMVGTDLQPNTAYVFTVETYASHLGVGINQPRIIYVAGAGVLTPAQDNGPVVSTFTRQTVTFTTTASGAVNLYILNGSATGGTAAIVAFRDANVELTSTFDAAMPYFDGSKPDTIDRRYEWTGAANNSASVVMVPASSDVLDPTLGILVPHVVTREARSVVQLLAESTNPTVSFVPPGPRSGVMSSVFADPAAAFAAQAWFSGNFDYVYIQDDATYANMRFRVADGEIEVEQTDAGTLLRVPFVEVAGAVT